MSVPTYPFGQYLPQRQPAVNPNDGTLVTSFYYLILALFNRTGGASGLAGTLGMSLAAAGADQAHATMLTNDISEVLTGAGLGVSLAALQPSQQQEVFNGTGGNIAIYPALNGLIDVLGVNNPYILANGKTQIFTCYKLLASGGSFYRSTQLG